MDQDKAEVNKSKKKWENKAKYLPILTNQVWSILYLSRSLSRKPFFLQDQNWRRQDLPILATWISNQNKGIA